jgi:hypothetical protein
MFNRANKPGARPSVCASGLAVSDSEMAPQSLEKMESGLGNGAAAQEPIWDS